MTSVRPDSRSTMTRRDHTYFMREAITLSLQELGSAHGRPFGAVVVKDGEIIGRGFNQTVLTHDPTAHAEIVAIRDAGKNSQNYRLDGCTMYSSCEPCPMCLAAMYWAGITTLYYGCSMIDSNAYGFEDQQYYRQLALPREARSIQSAQLLREEALKAFTVFKEGRGRP